MKTILLIIVLLPLSLFTHASQTRDILDVRFDSTDSEHLLIKQNMYTNEGYSLELVKSTSLSSSPQPEVLHKEFYRSSFILPRQRHSSDNLHLISGFITGFSKLITQDSYKEVSSICGFSNYLVSVISNDFLSNHNIIFKIPFESRGFITKVCDHKENVLLPLYPIKYIKSGPSGRWVITVDPNGQSLDVFDKTAKKKLDFSPLSIHSSFSFLRDDLILGYGIGLSIFRRNTILWNLSKDKFKKLFVSTSEKFIKTKYFKKINENSVVIIGKGDLRENIIALYNLSGLDWENGYSLLPEKEFYSANGLLFEVDQLQSSLLIKNQNNDLYIDESKNWLWFRAMKYLDETRIEKKPFYFLFSLKNGFPKRLTHIMPSDWANKGALQSFSPTGDIAVLYNHTTKTLSFVETNNFNNVLAMVPNIDTEYKNLRIEFNKKESKVILSKFYSNKWPSSFQVVEL